MASGDVIPISIILAITSVALSRSHDLAWWESDVFDWMAWREGLHQTRKSSRSRDKVHWPLLTPFLDELSSQVLHVEPLLWYLLAVVMPKPHQEIRNGVDLHVDQICGGDLHRRGNSVSEFACLETRSGIVEFPRFEIQWMSVGTWSDVASGWSDRASSCHSVEAVISRGSSWWSMPRPFSVDGPHDSLRPCPG